MIERESLRIYQLSVFVLAVEWIVFGSMHFTLHEETIRQLPAFIPSYARSFVVTTTGWWRWPPESCC